MSDTFPKTTIPLIHLNGTSANELQREVREAYDAIKVARDKLAAMTVHGRDHYPKADKDSFRKAQAEHQARFVALDKIKEELQDIWLGINEQKRTKTDDHLEGS